MQIRFRYSAAMLCLVLLMGLNAPAVQAQSHEPEISVEDITGWAEDPALDVLPVSVEAAEENGFHLLRKTFVVEGDVSPSALIEPEFSRLGCAYVYLETLKEELPGTAETKPMEKTVVILSDTNDLAAIAAAQEPSLPYDADGFSGELVLDESRIFVQEGKKESYSYGVSDTKTYAGLAAQDPYLVPKEVTKNGVTLSLSDITWTAEGVQPDGSGLPASYTARVSYAGRGYGTKVTEYQATLSYSGEVSKIIPGQVQYTLVYGEVQPQSHEEELPAAEPAAEKTARSPSIPFWLMASGGALLALGTGLWIGKKGERKTK